MSERRILAFVEKLANQKVFSNTTNQYSYQLASNKIRRDNLINYLLAMFENKSKVLLVSEAPGYKGMKLTGVPFSSEYTLLTHPFFTGNKNIKVEFNGISERSAKNVWNALDEIGFIPLMFPAFPFHPNDTGKTNSNRKPTEEELLIGVQYLRELIDIFKIIDFIAVGREAESTLLKMNIIAPYVHHPSYDLKNEFKPGLEKHLSLFK